MAITTARVTSQQINYKTGFKEIVTLGSQELVGKPFRFTYTAGVYRTAKYIALWDGSNTEKGWVNARKDDSDDYTLLVVFDRHGLPSGRLHVRREFALNDEDFAHGIWNWVMEEDLDVELVSGSTVDLSTSVSVSSVVTANIMRGKTGPQGEEGKSAYEVAKEAGYEGTESAFGKQLYEQVVTSKEFESEEIDFTDPTSDANAVRYVEQTLTSAEKQQARDNINAFDADEATICEDIDVEVVASDPNITTEAVRWTPQTLSDANKTQARTNIGAASSFEYGNTDISKGDKGRVVVLEEKMRYIEQQTNSVVGDMNDLETTDKDFVVNSINEVCDKLGHTKTLTTTAQNAIDAINELDAKIPEDEDTDINMPLQIFS